MNPLVSIIVPVYNREEIIKPTIESVLGQTYQNWELIIVDDGSTDNTIATVESYREKEQRIRLIKRNRDPKGAPVCRNIGLEEAKGEYLIFLDSDDILIHTTLEERVREFQRHTECDFIVFPSAFFLKDPQDAEHWWNRFDDNNDLERFLLQDVVWHTSGPIWKRSFLTGGSFFFDETALTSQDWEFHLRILLAAPNYTKVDSLPDSFIRRDGGYEKISDAHHSSIQLQNRISVIHSILYKMETPDTSRELLYYSLMKEYARLMDKQVLLTTEMIEKIPVNLFRESQNKKMYAYIKTANKLSGINFNLYRVFRKVRYKAICDKNIYPAGSYRSKMTLQEVDAIKQRLTVPVNISEWRNDPGQRS